MLGYADCAILVIVFGGRRFKRFALVAGVVLALPLVARAAEDALPLPRFVSLRSEDVNVRTGPGVRYPIDWVLRRKAMPVEILDQFETSRKIRDWEGGIGWVHQSMLSGRRMILVTGAVRSIRGKPDPQGETLATVEPGVVGKLLECQRQWCRVDVGGRRGWLLRTEFWGVYPNETIE